MTSALQSGGATGKGGSEGSGYSCRLHSANHSLEDWALLPGSACLCSLPLGTCIEIPQSENH